MCTFVLECAKTGEQITAQLLQDYLRTENFEAPCLMVLKEDIKMAGLRFGQGQRQNTWQHSDEIVVYREKYVSRRLDNLNHKGLPIKAEVFFDESYCYIYHHIRKGPDMYLIVHLRSSKISCEKYIPNCKSHHYQILTLCIS